jgi:hypothetical protein
MSYFQKKMSALFDYVSQFDRNQMILSASVAVVAIVGANQLLGGGGRHSPWMKISNGSLNNVNRNKKAN